MTQIQAFSLIDLRSAVYAALKAWHQTNGNSHDLLDMLLLTHIRRELLASTSPTSLRLAANEVLLNGIDELKRQEPEFANVLLNRFADQEQLRQIAQRMHVSESTVSRLQVRSIDSLVTVLYEQEIEQRISKQQFIEANLPAPSYTELFGRAQICTHIQELILSEAGPSVISLVGIGGIGKTALADAVVRKIAPLFCFEHVIWLRAEPQTMSGWSNNPQVSFESIIYDLAESLDIETVQHSHIERLTLIRQILKSKPCLIVIDNLETEQDTAYLLSELNNLAQPSKFLLTSRTRAILNVSSIYYYTVPRLTKKEASDLLFQQAELLGIGLFSSIDPQNIETIYKIVGGNPLALKIVVSMLDLLSLPQILNNLSKNPSGAIESMYLHIYWQAWQILTSQARSLLQAMPLVSESGGEPDYLQSISRLPDNEFWPALQELRNRSLIEVRGTLQEKKYGIHRLTRTFLYTEINHWSPTQPNHEI